MSSRCLQHHALKSVSTLHLTHCGISGHYTMSRTAQRDPVPVEHEGADDDVCPVCKSARYLNPSMKFKINPVCWHKMCESCIDRIFSHGPAQCPIAGCGATLRKHRFRKQTFADIAMEREVSIRKQIAEKVNLREEDFEDLRSWNDYLNTVEDWTFNLINNIDVEQTQKDLEAFQIGHRDVILRNKRLAGQETRDLGVHMAAEKEAARLRREAARQEDEEERMERARSKDDVINKLAREAGGDVRKPTSTARKTAFEQQQNLRARRLVDTTITTGQDGGSMTNVMTDSSSSTPMKIKGLKQYKEPEPEAAYDAFAGLRFEVKYTVLQSDNRAYDFPWLDRAREDPAWSAGGYDVQAYCARALEDAFAGLGVFVEEEVGGRTVGQGREEEHAGHDSTYASHLANRAAAAKVAVTSEKIEKIAGDEKTATAVTGDDVF